MITLPNLIFITDPDRFMRLVKTTNSRQRLFELRESFGDMMLCELVRYGHYNDATMIGGLTELYRSVFMQAPEPVRLEIYGHVKFLLEKTSLISVNALLPFITVDDSVAVVGTATIDFVSLGQLTEGDPMSRVKDIVGMLETGSLVNEGAAFGALLNLGDFRVCALLGPLRYNLGSDAIREVTHAGTGTMKAATIEFYLDWLETLDMTSEGFGLVASGLELLSQHGRDDLVATGNRPFPVIGISSAEWLAMQKAVPLAEYLARVTARFQALERSEPPPRVMTHVMQGWGIATVTDPHEAVPRRN
jgi:hypothetical protein